jgi:hypothetical protein
LSQHANAVGAVGHRGRKAEEQQHGEGEERAASGDDVEGAGHQAGHGKQDDVEREGHA